MVSLQGTGAKDIICQIQDLIAVLIKRRDLIRRRYNGSVLASIRIHHSYSINIIVFIKSHIQQFSIRNSDLMNLLIIRQLFLIVSIVIRGI